MEGSRPVRSALILDDQTAYIRALARSLRGSLEVTGAETRSSATMLLRKDMTVAIVDICLAAADPTNREGLEFIRWLRAERPAIRIIAMSARDEADISTRALAAGADTFLSKPLRMSELRELLARFSGDGS